MKIIITILILIGTLNLNAQSIQKQVIGSTGGTANSASIILTSTTGEVAVKIASSGTIVLTQGFQQATDSGSVSIKEIQVTANYKLYPNPTTNGAKLEITTLNLDAEVSILLYSKEGKLLSTQKLNLTSGVKSSANIDLNGKAKGVYFVKIFDSKSKLSKTLRVVKQ